MPLYFCTQLRLGTQSLYCFRISKQGLQSWERLTLWLGDAMDTIQPTVIILLEIGEGMTVYLNLQKL